VIALFFFYFGNKQKKIMENSFREEKGIFNLQVDEVSKAHLKEAARWGTFLSIMSFIGMALFIIVFTAAGAQLSTMSGGTSLYSLLGATGMLLYVVFIVGIYFYPVYALFKFSTNIKAGVNTSDQARFNKGLAYLKGMFKYMGILIIIMLALSVLVFIVAIIAAMAFSS
jgi:hypothetical protein